jgi:hypothetical protein
MPDSTPSGPTLLTRRETLRRAAGALALGLGVPVTALAATDEDAVDFRLSFWKVEEAESFMSVRLNAADARRLQQASGSSYIKFDGVDGESVRTLNTWVIIKETR